MLGREVTTPTGKRSRDDVRRLDLKACSPVARRKVWWRHGPVRLPWGVIERSASGESLHTHTSVPLSLSGRESLCYIQLQQSSILWGGTKHERLVQSVRTPDRHSGGYWFESSIAHHL
jgi:hypothetical protein